jgi:hypothetical protein
MEPTASAPEVLRTTAGEEAAPRAVGVFEAVPPGPIN